MIEITINSKAYDNQKFNATLTSALQLSLFRENSIKFTIGSATSFYPIHYFSPNNMKDKK